MGAQTPQWLTNSIVEALQEIGATAANDQLEAEANYLIGQWDLPGRVVHNGRYLANLFERLDDFAGATADPAILRVAACYQGAGADLVWETLGGAPKACANPDLHPATRLAALGVPTETAERIQALVQKLNSAILPTDDMEAKILFDADLALLATSPQNYTKLRKSLRHECAGLEDPIFLQARRKFIKELLGRPKIFLTPFANHLAQKLRDNLEGELSRIDALLAISEDNDNGAAEKPAGGGPRSGAILIRSSRIQKQQKLQQEAAQAEADAEASEDSQTIQTTDSEADTTGEKIIVDSDLAHDIDDTSTLESFDDPFSYRRHQ